MWFSCINIVSHEGHCKYWKNLAHFTHPQNTPGKKQHGTAKEKKNSVIFWASDRSPRRYSQQLGNAGQPPIVCVSPWDRKKATTIIRMQQPNEKSDACPLSLSTFMMCHVNEWSCKIIVIRNGNWSFSYVLICKRVPSNNPMAQQGRVLPLQISTWKTRLPILFSWKGESCQLNTQGMEPFSLVHSI